MFVLSVYDNDVPVIMSSSVTALTKLCKLLLFDGKKLHHLVKFVVTLAYPICCQFIYSSFGLFSFTLN